MLKVPHQGTGLVSGPVLPVPARPDRWRPGRADGGSVWWACVPGVRYGVPVARWPCGGWWRRLEGVLGVRVESSC